MPLKVALYLITFQMEDIKIISKNLHAFMNIHKNLGLNVFRTEHDKTNKLIERLDNR